MIRNSISNAPVTISLTVVAVASAPEVTLSSLSCSTLIASSPRWSIWS